MSAPALHYSVADSLRAKSQWRANCGPHSLAASLGRSIEGVRPLLETPFKGWMNPTHITAALVRAGQAFILTRGLHSKSLCNGINRVQWEGPWLDPGRTPAEAYKHTHWVAHHEGWVLCTATEHAAWQRVEDWQKVLVDANEAWHITHHYEFTSAALSTREHGDV